MTPAPLQPVALERLTLKAKTTAVLALDAGWTVKARCAYRTALGPTGEPLFVKGKEARVNEDGSPVLTKTGKQSFRMTDTDVVARYFIEVLTMGRTWEREPLRVAVIYRDSEFNTGWVNGAQRGLVGYQAVTPLKAVLSSGGRPADVTTTKESR